MFKFKIIDLFVVLDITNSDPDLNVTLEIYNVPESFVLNVTSINLSVVSSLYPSGATASFIP
ncbi:hypothetical protein D3C72_1191020 [compost metagenome]